MTITNKLLRGGSARTTSRGTQVIEVYRSEETGGTLFVNATDPIAMIRIANDGNSGPEIPEQGSSKTFDVGGTEQSLDCVEVIVRRESCNRVQFQCRFSNFVYWSGPGTPSGPDPRVVYSKASLTEVITAPKFTKVTLESDGGSGSVETWILELMPIRIRTVELAIRCYIAGGITDEVYGEIIDKVGDLHEFSGVDWEFLGVDVNESAGGFIAGDPVYLTYRWKTEYPTGAMFTDGDSRDPEVMEIPARDPFHRYVWTQKDDGTPVITTELVEGSEYLNDQNKTGYTTFPSPKPILS